MTFVEHTSDVLKHGYFRSVSFNTSKKNREPISRIIAPHLQPTDAERLAWRAADNYMRFDVQVRFFCQADAITVSVQIFSIRRTSIFHHFKANRRKTDRFKSKCQASAAGKEIYNYWRGPIWLLWFEFLVHIVYKLAGIHN